MPRLPLLSAIAALLLATAAPAMANFATCPQHFASAMAPVLPPAAPAQQRELCFQDFAVGYSGQTKTPLYVAERLSAASLRKAKAIPRKDAFYEEARLPSAMRAKLSDYRGSGFDRGHMAPAANMPSENGMAQSFSLSNMVPQVAANNRGPWADIEKATRKYVERAQGDVFVVTGSVFEGPVQTIGAGKVAVPSHLYKLVYDASNGKVWAHWIENNEEARVSKPISYDDLARRTRIDFFGRKLSN